MYPKTVPYHIERGRYKRRSFRALLKIHAREDAVLDAHYAIIRPISDCISRRLAAEKHDKRRWYLLSLRTLAVSEARMKRILSRYSRQRDRLWWHGIQKESYLKYQYRSALNPEGNHEYQEISAETCRPEVDSSEDRGGALRKAKDQTKKGRRSNRGLHRSGGKGVSGRKVTAVANQAKGQE